MQNVNERSAAMERIKKFSRTVCSVLRFVIIIYIVVLALEILVYGWYTFDWPTTVVKFHGQSVTVPYLFKLGDFQVYLPIFILGEPNIEILGLGKAVSQINFGDVLDTLIKVIALSFARRVFLILRADGSPFKAKAVAEMKKLAIVLLILGVMTGTIGWIAAGIVWVLCLIFDYGRLLQDESDQTL